MGLMRRLSLSIALAALFSAACASTSRTTGPAAPGASAPPSGPAAASSPAREATGRQRWLEMFARGYFPGRSGQVFVVPREGDVITERDPLYNFMHGSPWAYDSHIPILFYGQPFITKGEFKEPVSQQDIAPTLGAIIGAAPAQTYTGRVQRQALASTAEIPRVVMLIVLDAMRADYFDTHADVMPTLTRMRREGAWFSAAHATALPTVTGVGHATIGTGTDPRFHGITVNNLFNRLTGRSSRPTTRSIRGS